MSDEPNPDECWICDSLDIGYVDVLGMGWCRKHLEEIYWGDDDDLH